LSLFQIDLCVVELDDLTRYFEKSVPLVNFDLRIEVNFLLTANIVTLAAGDVFATRRLRRTIRQEIA
jgi:hypothetical protein